MYFNNWLWCRFKKIKLAAVKKWKSLHKSNEENDKDLLQYHEIENLTESVVTVSYA